MQTEFLFSPLAPTRDKGASLTVGTARVPLQFVRHRRARRYILRLTSEGVARVTIPRGGSTAEGRRFADRQIEWIERQMRRRQEGALRPTGLFIGSQILFRGEPILLSAGAADGALVIRFADQAVRIENLFDDVRPRLEQHLWSMAQAELPPRVRALAEQHGFAVRGVRVRNQRTRWGSCSRHGAISLNWRLIQVPEPVRDYIILHELAHLREMNHSARFWSEVAKLCPSYREAERWLRTQGKPLVVS
ncbi:MAG TPA: SprT family zinc-dependent metalloprotease [Verrucomicrobiota bacterium]|nr:SprT family zinc-dependent metalloprotease [Verrucomicrobiota bacterium]